VILGSFLYQLELKENDPKILIRFD
jgi:hypothetical protein